MIYLKIRETCHKMKFQKITSVKIVNIDELVHCDFVKNIIILKSLT